MTLICVPIMVHDEPQAAADALAARDAGADLVEFRIDEFFTGIAPGRSDELDPAQVDAILRLVAASPLACIVTCRAASEAGDVGGYTDDEHARVTLYEHLGTASSGSETRGHSASAGELKHHPPRYLDFEYAAYTRSANIRQKINLAVTHPGQLRADATTGLILSTHDFSGRPADLSRRVVRMQHEPAASVVKFAFRARSLRDNLEVFDLLRENASSGQKPMIGLAMGEFGLLSRVLAPKFGGFLTFASLRKASTTAPGQPTVRELIDIYRFRAIKPTTKVYGVIGSPSAVAHSLSPLVHNAGFEAIGFDGVYLPLPIAADDNDPEATYLSFKATIDELLDFAGLDLAGLSVTMPFKEMLVRWADGRRDDADLSIIADPGVVAIGAANTLAIDGPTGGAGSGGAQRGHSGSITNTDASAIADLLDGALAGIAGRTVGVIGAGGVARAAIWACASRGAAVEVFNRSKDKAEAIAVELNARLAQLGSGAGRVIAADTTSLPSARADAFINCTPVGMTGGPDPGGLAAPVAEMSACPKHAVFMDTVYNPVETPFLLAARTRGLPVIDGVSMFVEQAAAQFTRWTGRPAPKQLFDRICREALSVRNS